MKFLTLIGVFVAMFSASSACRCAQLPEPAMCRTQYLILAKITGLEVHEENSVRQYNYEVIEDISYPGPVTTNKRFSHIRTGSNYGSCQLDLMVGQTYLLGGQISEKENLLYATTCGTYFKEWNLRGQESADQLSETRMKCRAFHEKPAIIVPGKL